MAEPEWIDSDYNIYRSAQRDAIAKELERGPVIIEHWFYFGGRSPDRVILEDVEDVDAYLRQKAKPGDAIHVWSFADVCRNDNAIAEGKIPNENDRVPKGGSY